MVKFAEDNEEFKNTVEHYLAGKLQTHELHEVSESSFSEIEKSGIYEVFYLELTQNDLSEILSEMSLFDFDELALITKKYVEDAFVRELVVQTQRMIREKL